MQYRRTFVPGGTYFFTVVTAARRKLFYDEGTVQLVRQAFSHVNTRRPFTVNAMVVLPDHLHCIWTLPTDDDDYPTRWRLIKTWVTKHYLPCLHHDSRGLGRREPTVWQARYWEHLIRDEEDYRQHVEYIHYNPVKHGQIPRPRDWPHSSFRQYVQERLYPREWGDTAPLLDEKVGHE
ncbi:MAG: transposase [Nitrospira sp. SB0677_bin_15]|nr:transposase [Nitrospira sp. SB0677_bin_15]